MKKTILLLSGIFLFSFFVKAQQEVGRFSLNPTAKPPAAKAEDRPQVKLYNALVDSVSKASLKSYQKQARLYDFAKANLETDSGFKKILPLIDSFKFEGNSLGALKIPDTTVTLTLVKTETSEAVAVCPRIGTLKELKVEKNNDAEYICTITDTTDNPVRSFVLKQFNEQLFNDKLKSAIYSICNGLTISKDDTAGIDKFYTATITKQNLYQRMLEASLEVKDDKVPAGVLKINKRITAVIEITPVKIKEKKKKKKKKGNNTSDSPAQSTGFNPMMSENISLANNSGRSGKGAVTAAEDDVMPEKIITNAQLNNVPKDSINPDGRLVIIKHLLIHDVNIQFQDGFIENIIVLGNLEGEQRELKFENAYPIAFSTRKDFRRLQDIDIYERTVYAKKRDNDSSCRINLGDMLFYIQNLQLNTKDYSPVNDVMEQKITEDVTSVNLYKELTSKILELKVFSDLKGIDNDEPNGLIQLELSKKLNFFSMRWPLSSKRAKVNVGLFNYFTPSFAMNKIEANNKRLIPSYIGTNYPDTLKPNVFASTLDLFQHQSFTVGGNLTVLTVDIPGLKSTINFNIGNYWGRVLIEDTLRSKIDSSHFSAIKDNNISHFGVNTVQFSPEVSWQVFPDKRYGFIFSQRFTKYRLESSVLRQVKDSADYTGFIKTLNGDRTQIGNYGFKKWLAVSEVYGFYSPSAYNKIFFRYRFNWDMNNIKNNFHQLQLGISTYLTHTKTPEQAKDKDK